MLKKLNTLLLVLLLAACQAQDTALKSVPTEGSETIDEKVIYGSDDRKDVYEVTSSLQKRLAESTVALIKASSIQTGANTSRIVSKTFKETYGLCSSERFGEQENAAFCSGSLVAPDIIATAGHCVRSASDCASTKFVFGYAVKVKGVLPREIANSEIYSCAEVIHTEVLASGSDFALVRLNRPVTNHAVLKIRQRGAIKVGDPLVVIGHPVGLPTKVAAGAKVRSAQPDQYFVANLDTYGGNSGSAVFNSKTGVVEGILVRGDDDFEHHGSCTVSHRCKDTECRGEDVTRITRILPYLF
ncbi:trypsin-like serine peptidase [Bdellovibrio sp. HCB-162]|uniref:trypsin-like serine peptidase n=1 Tax=Bdellovibrio sp. HCB-162 TaxID=3394234 RepID=UPI0039BCCF07